MEILVGILILVAGLLGIKLGKDQERKKQFEEDLQEHEEQVRTEDEQHRREHEDIEAPDPVDDPDDAMDNLNERFGSSGDPEG